MRWSILVVAAALILMGTSLVGCVSRRAHEKSLAELAESCRVAGHSAVAFERYKQDADSQIRALEEERERLGREYVATKNELTRAQTDLQSAQYHLAHEQEARRGAETEVRNLLQDREVLASRVQDLEGRLELKEEKLDQGTEVRAVGKAKLELLAEDRVRLEGQLLSAQTAATEAEQRLAAAHEALRNEQAGRQEADRALLRARERSEQVERLEIEVRRERDALQEKLADVTARLRAAREALVESGQALHETRERVGSLQAEQSQTRAALDEVTSETKRLRAALAAEREMWVGLQEALKKVERPPRAGVTE